MAVVDIKGTMRDFCSVTCLTSFKSNSVSTLSPQSLCSMCNKSCTVRKNFFFFFKFKSIKLCLLYSLLPYLYLLQTTCELTLNDAVHKFCSDSCLEGFRKDNNVAVCENCNSPCHKKLMLKLEDDTKTICSVGCVDKFKEVQKYEMFLFNKTVYSPQKQCHRLQFSANT